MKSKGLSVYDSGEEGLPPRRSSVVQIYLGTSALEVVAHGRLWEILGHLYVKS